jgi:hypothetical protein
MTQPLAPWTPKSGECPARLTRAGGRKEQCPILQHCPPCKSTGLRSSGADRRRQQPAAACIVACSATSVLLCLSLPGAMARLVAAAAATQVCHLRAEQLRVPGPLWAH